MSRIGINFPIKGLSDATSYHEQTPETTQLALNMRGRDPITGRFRGAQRSGMTKFVPDEVYASTASFIQDIAGLVYDLNLSTYAVAASPSIQWSRVNDASDVTRDIAVSAGGDVFIIAGNGVLQKFNTNGRKVLKVQLPLTLDSEEAMSVAVDAQGFVYVSTQATGNGDENTLYEGKVYCYQPSLTVDDQLDLWWTYDADGRVPDIAENLGTLFIIVNMGPYETELRALGSLSSSEPAIRWDRPIANPSNKLVIDSSGDVIVSSPPNPDRIDTTIGSACSTKVDPNDMWSPNELGSDIRAWFRAEDVPDKADGELVDFWLDISGNNRNLTASASSAGLRFVEDAVCGLPGLRAWGSLHGSGKPPGLRSLSGQGNPVPINNDPHFITMVVKLRDPNQGVDQFPNGFHGVIFEVGGFPKTKIGVYNGGDVIGFDTSQHFDADATTGVNASVAQSTGDTNIPDSDPITNEDKFAIITWAKKPIYGLNLASGTNGERVEASFIRINGKTHYQYTHNNSANAFRSFFGYGYYEDPPGFQYAFGDMDFCEIISIEADYLWPSDFTGCPDTADAGNDGIDYDTPGAGQESWKGETVTLASSDDSEIELVEGYLAHKYGLAGVLDSSHPFAGVGNEPAKGTEDDTDPVADEGDIDVLRSLDGIVAKFGNAGGVLRWAYTGAGVGHGLAVGLDPEDDGVYTTGPVVASPSDSTTARRLVDQGFEVSDTGGDGAWALTATNLQSAGVDQRIAVDKQKNVYVPIGDGTNHLVKIDAAASTEFTYTIPSVTLNGVVVVTDTLITDYGDDTIEEPEFVYFGGDPGTVGSTDHTLYKLRLVTVSIQVGAPRGIRVISVCDGDIRRLEPDAASPNSVVTVTDGAGALNADSRIVRSIEADGKLYFIDGVQYKLYDPVADAVTEWEAVGSGSLPRQARLIEYWRGRVLLARTAGDASNIFMSEVGNPLGWDLDPPVIKLTQAVSLAATQAGRVPDIVNAMIPYNDDLLIIGGDHSIYRLTGDPMGAGQLDLVSDMTGMAFGRPWCKDPSGSVYFFGSRGGVFRMSAGSGIQKISSPRLDRRLEQVDLEFYTVRMAYDTQSRGVYVWFVPIDVVGAVLGPGRVTASQNPILDDGNVTFTYDGRASYLNGQSPVFISYEFDDPEMGSPTIVSMTGGATDIWTTVVAVPDGAENIYMTFHNTALAIVDDNDGDDWTFPISDSGDPETEDPPGYDGSFGGDLIGGSFGGASANPIMEDRDPAQFDPAVQAATGYGIIHFFYEIDTDAWWMDQYADTGFEPTAVAVVDGDDAEDRRVLIGGADGYIRMVDQDAKNDDGLAIDAYVRIGPVMPKEPTRQYRFTDFELTLASDQDGCSMSLFAGDTSEPIADSMGDKAMVAGRNNSWLKKVKGQSVFVQLRNSVVDQRFAIESLGCSVAEAGGV